MTALSEAMNLFIEVRKREVLHSDLLDRWHWGMETQLTVHQADGEVHADHPSVFSNGITDWWPIRIPKDAGGEPRFKNYELTWPIRDYWDSLGLTGWNWLEKRSICMGADFDTITGHALGVGITDGTLAEVKDRASQIPFVEVRHSTRGKGIHLWVDFEREDIIIENHHDHAAVCRAVLGEMSRLAEFDFQASVDACGGNMWIDHRKQHANQFALIEPAAEKFKISSVDWESHRDVIKGTRTTVRIAKIDDEVQDELDLLTHSRHKTQPDATHLRIQQTLIDNGVVCVYVPDHNLFRYTLTD